jgi:hypothetical protein
MSKRETFFDRNYISKAIYGSISVLAVLLVMQEHPPTAWKAALTLFGATLAIALAEAYSSTIAEMIAQKKRLDAKETKEIWRHTRPILLSANLPTLILLLSATGLYGVGLALEIAEYAIYLALFIYGLRVGQLLHGVWWRRVLSGLTALAMGVLIGLIKYFFH